MTKKDCRFKSFFHSYFKQKYTGGNRMKFNKLDILWAISLFVILAATILLAGLPLAGVVLPDAVVRTAGILDLAALPVLVFTSMKRNRARG